jgi:HPt (histidine-containing phosphotransfer) domain-containing protein
MLNTKTAKPALAQTVRALRLSFSSGLPDRIASIAQALATIDAEHIDEVIRELHSLSGMATAYQFHDIAQLAAEAEALCEEYAIDSTLCAVVSELEESALALANVVPFNMPEAGGTFEGDHAGGLVRAFGD